MTCLSTSTQVTITVSDHNFSGLHTYFHFDRIFEANRLLQARRSLNLGCLEKRIFFSLFFCLWFGFSLYHKLCSNILPLHFFFYLKFILSQLLIVFGEILQKDFRVFQKCFYWPKSVLLLYPYWPLKKKKKSVQLSWGFPSWIFT